MQLFHHCFHWIKRVLLKKMERNWKNLDIFTKPSGRWHVGIFATRDILPLEEITFSYSNGRSRGDGFASSDPCHCGAASCTGRIAEPPKKYQKRCSFANRTSKKMKAKDKSTRNPVKNKKKQNGGFLRKPRRRQELEVAESDVLKGMDSTPETEKNVGVSVLVTRGWLENRSRSQGQQLWDRGGGSGWRHHWGWRWDWHTSEYQSK